ncbi:membrane protein [Herbaspirillum rubrisubalbicans]|uniref:Membrane protein n=1 Tax=Herbaspirillum rubrisubalbicans TaxID=80842 RepID=A0ABX9C388_9BURK|nr:YjgN family protein [Herbaspirillum rubrisubalbicans]RAM64609.1 membrane protein [Herbaspirillum rubrisubalbicans]RAN49943.1 membrane protein [Herbaspirillum rubrisubalbicans]
MNDQSDLPESAAQPPSTPPQAPANFATALRDSADHSAPQGFSFSGSGSEYFRIWIVNLLLSVVTLGIYSAWAKVRRLRYFYANTSVAGASFDYHGNPMAILKGRIIAVVVMGLYQLAAAFNVVLGLIAAIVMAVAGPWLIWRSLQFKLYNTSYRGIRFGFRGSAGGVFKNFFVWPALGSISVGLLAPLAYQRFKRYQHGQSRFGATQFDFTGKPGAFYKVFLIAFGIWLAGFLAGIAALVAVGYSHISLFVMLPHGLPIIIALYAWTFAIYPLLMTQLQNLVWNSTRLGEHRFKSTMRWQRVVFIFVTNLLGIAFTLGLYTPFAQIRMMRYRIESLALLPAGNLDEFLAASEPHGSATSEGLGDLLDFDLSM